jgi:HAMP domain-containing protein
LGDFDTEIIVKSNDEIGDLGNSIDRMRESLKAAIDRLRKRQKMKI